MKLNYKSMGQGPALIILHGLFGSLDNWVSHARFFSTEFTVYIIDQRNHGKSPHDDVWNYGVMADDLRDFMDDHGIYQAHLVGHSMGGKVVMQFAADYPERIMKLVVADMAPKSYSPHHTAILEALMGLDLAQIYNRKAADTQLTHAIPTFMTRQFLLKSLKRADQNTFTWKFNLPVIYRDYEKILEKVEVDPPFEGPTLFLYGGKSTYLTAEDPEWIRALFPQAVFECLEGAGHWLHAEAPDAFQKALTRFLL